MLLFDCDRPNRTIFLLFKMFLLLSITCMDIAGSSRVRFMASKRRRRWGEPSNTPLIEEGEENSGDEELIETEVLTDPFSGGQQTLRYSQVLKLI